MFYIFKKTEGLYLIRFIRYIEYNNQIFPVTLYKSMTLRGIIPQRVKQKICQNMTHGGIIPWGVIEPNFSQNFPRGGIPRWVNIPESHTSASQSPLGIIQRWVNLPRVCNPRELTVIF